MKALSVCGIIGIVMSGLAIYAILDVTAELEAASGVLETGVSAEFSGSLYGDLCVGLIGAIFGLAQSLVCLVAAADRRRRMQGGSR